MQIEIVKIDKLGKVENLLKQYDLQFKPSISSRVSNLKSYSLKLYNNARIFVAKSNETHEDLGFIAIYMNDIIRFEAYITQLAVNSKAKKEGIGTKLLNYAIDEAAHAGMKQIRAEVYSHNNASKACFSKSGFVISENASSDSVYMIKFL